MTDVYAAVEAIVRTPDQPASAVCAVLEVSRSAYDAWLTPGRSAQAARDAELSPLVRDLFGTHRQRYATRRIVAELAERGESCGARRVAKLLKTPGLSALQPKSFVPRTTDSRHRRGDRPNLLLDRPALTAIHPRWVGDITSVPLAGGAFCDLATRRDRFSQRLIQDLVAWFVGCDQAPELFRVVHVDGVAKFVNQDVAHEIRGKKEQLRIEREIPLR